MLKIRNARGGFDSEVKPKAEKDWMAAPTRPPGTEEMTCHLDEGSKGGACGEGYAGFRSDWLPWVSCGTCLVQLDWSIEQTLLELKGLYVVPLKIASE